MSESNLTKRRLMLKAAAALPLGLPALAGLSSAYAQVPSNGKLIVGFAAGGGADLTARLLAEKLKEVLSMSQFVVENRTGAAGKIAVDALRASPADGSTLLLAPLVTPVLSQLTFSNPGYDPGKHFTPVGLVGFFEFAIAVPSAHPAKNIKELAAWLKANPDKATFGSPSAGSLPHFFGVLLGRSLSVPMAHVAYRGGAPMLADLVSGQINCGIDTELEMLELHKSGKIRVLATFAKERTAALPDVPTMIESGFKDAVGSAWYSVWAPAGTPANTVATLNKALNAVLTSPDILAKFKVWGLAPTTSTPAALEQLRLADIEKWRPIVAASGFKAD
jgi:tripartite-type tricarboxylate transporter receptor subunit TctC